MKSPQAVRNVVHEQHQVGLSRAARLANVEGTGAELYQQLDALRALRPEVRGDLLVEAKEHLL
jgi:hypothetical protein